MKKIAFHTLGCKVNLYETEAMRQLLLRAGYAEVAFEDKADAYIINTCSVTNIADRKSRQMLHKAKKENPKAAIVAVGCYVQAAAQKLREDEAVDIIVGNNLKKDIVQIMDEYFMAFDQRDAEAFPEHLKEKRGKHDYVIDIHKSREFENMDISEVQQHARAFIKVQDGCNQFCTYCIIPFTRGRVRSRRPEDILGEITRMTGRGFREIVLTGIHLSSYGAEGGQGEFPSLLGLIEQISSVEGVERIRLGSLEPRVITEEFMQGLKNIRQICPHFHLSLQSGCDSVLERMNRRYTVEEFRGGVELIRRYYDMPAITTDVIVGFPGESEEEFEKTLQFVREIGFYEMHIFPFSPREGTKAAGMKEILTKKQKSERVNILSEQEQKMSSAYRQDSIGRTAEVLIEESMVFEGREYHIGYTREYIRVAVADPGLHRRDIAEIKIVGKLTQDILLGEKL